MEHLASPGGPAARPLTILIVDDSAMMRAVIRRAAQLADVPLAGVLEAGNGAEAIRLLESTPVDAVFIDINMPVMNGTQLLSEIDRRREWDALARVIVSSDASEARREEVSRFRVRRYVEKPFRPEVFRDVLTELADTLQ